MASLIKPQFVGDIVVSNTGSLRIPEEPTDKELKFLYEFCPDCFIEKPKAELKTQVVLVAPETTMVQPIVTTSEIVETPQLPPPPKNK